MNFGGRLRPPRSYRHPMERLLLLLRFTGRVSVVMQNGRVLKSGYEEGYFHHRKSGGTDEEIAQNL